MPVNADDAIRNRATTKIPVAMKFENEDGALTGALYQVRVRNSVVGLACKKLCMDSP